MVYERFILHWSRCREDLDFNIDKTQVADFNLEQQTAATQNLEKIQRTFIQASKSLFYMYVFKHVAKATGCKTPSLT